MTQSYSDAGEILHVPDGQCTGRFKSGIGREGNGYTFIMRKINKRKKKKKGKERKNILEIMALYKIT